MQQHAGIHARPGDTSRFVVALVVALVCLVTVAWWVALFLLGRLLIGAIF